LDVISSVISKNGLLIFCVLLVLVQTRSFILFNDALVEWSSAW